MRPVVALALLCVAGTSSHAQGTAAKQCQIYFEGTTDTTRSNTVRNADGSYTTWVGGGVRARCRGTNMLLTADSAEHSPSARVVTLVGHARYREDSTAISSNSMRYTELDERVLAEGNVTARMRSGSTLDAAQVNYLRPQGKTRPFAIVDAYGRSHLVLRDSAKMTDSAATKVEADHLHMERDSLYNAGGRVVITRPDVKATADSAASDAGKGLLRLIGGSPTIEGRGDRVFRVEGRVLDVFNKKKQVDSLHALGRAVAVSDSMTLTADTLHLKTTGTLIDRVLAWGPTRAHAISPERDISALRIELVMPKQQLREMIATGRARAETKPDSLVRSKERDWIEGDTLNALFDQLAAKDTAKQPPLKEIRSRGNARSFYQVPPRERADSLPTLNYVIGKRIDVAFLKGEVQNVRVTGEVRGINMSPVKTDTTAAKATPRASTGRGGSR